MTNRRYRLMLAADADGRTRRFAVELAHFLGFGSMSAEFPVTVTPDGVQEADTLYFAIGCAPEGGGIVPVSAEGDQAKTLAEIAEKYLAAPRAAQRPQGYASAYDDIRADIRMPAEGGGLEQLFEYGWLLRDDDRDGLPDKLDCRLVLPDDMDDAACRAACDLAFRLGMESAGVSFPLTAAESCGGTDCIVFSGVGAAGIELTASEPHRLITVTGGGAELTAFMSSFVTRFPLAAGDLRVCDAARHIGGALALREADGHAAYMQAYGAESLLLPAGADIEKFRARWGGTEFHIHKDFYSAETREFALPDELAAARALLAERVYPHMAAGDRVTVTGALCKDREVRERLEKELERELRQRGAEAERVSLICAYKQGESWLEEDFAPRAAKIGAVSRVLVRFDPYTRAGGEKHVEKPPRWLQALYPADELIAPLLGISRDEVSFEAYSGEEELTYEAEAYGADGELILRDTLRVPTGERPFLDEFPELGSALPETGWLRVSVNGSVLLEERIKTDIEHIWDVFQTEILPRARRFTEERLGRAPQICDQPFFSRLEVEAGVSAPDRELGLRTDRISAAEALHNCLHRVGQRFFAQYGVQCGGKPFSEPGIVLPCVHVREGAPTLKMTLKLPYGREPSHAAPPREVRLRRVEAAAGGLRLRLETEGCDPAIAAALMALTEEGFTELAAMLEGYGELILRDVRSDEEYRAALPRMPQPQPLSAAEADIPTEGLIGYDAYAAVIERLRRVPELRVYKAGQSYQGRAIYAVEPRSAMRGYVSRTKRLLHLPSVIIAGRHHANEVSATNGIFAFIKELLHNGEYAGIGDRLNMVLLPVENADGAALHWELAQEHPNWELCCCYTNALAADLMPNYFKDDTIHTGAKAVTRLLRERLPDVYLDLHGVPHHEKNDIFGQLAEYKGLWLPRSRLCVFYFHVDEEAYSANKAFSREWSRRVAAGYADDAEYVAAGEEWRERFEKYSWDGIDGLFPFEYQNALLTYWVPSRYDPRHPYFSVSYPWVITMMFTAEAADETAQGEYAGACGRAHLSHLRSGVECLLESRSVMEERTERGEDGLSVRCRRLRPLLPPEKS
ncbi:MAG: hypothetical protein IJU78_08900 [Clostridia bacterium]|nr:hypothetical protein [Clostridia bacterium]